MLSILLAELFDLVIVTLVTPLGNFCGFAVKELMLLFDPDNIFFGENSMSDGFDCFPVSFSLTFC